ncbi:hypothetical protein MRB53_013797 [Persea americana]|uniref:Uncharacterized protein n=1 Tax=Persea americana TaxID=3435 RepID=A0ACC2K942_PERAE|nr:hypothetical protein MRB53_013797 [Persea americana]
MRDGRGRTGNNRRSSFRHMQMTHKRPDALQENHLVRILLGVIGIRLRGLRQKVQEMSATRRLDSRSCIFTASHYRFMAFFDLGVRYHRTSGPDCGKHPEQSFHINGDGILHQMGKR